MSEELKQYLQLNKLTEAMHMVAGELFNFKFTPVPEGSVPVFHEDVKVWEVTDLTSGQNVGLWYLDPYARQGKRSGAWATSYRSYTTFEGNKTVLSSNNSNFVKAPAGQPVLISWDDATLLFVSCLEKNASGQKYSLGDGRIRDRFGRFPWGDGSRRV